MKTKFLILISGIILLAGQCFGIDDKMFDLIFEGFHTAEQLAKMEKGLKTNMMDIRTRLLIFPDETVKTKYMVELKTMFDGHYKVLNITSAYKTKLKECFEKQFTETELKVIADFFGTEAGKKFYKGVPLVMEEITKWMNEIMSKNNRELMTKVTAIENKLGLKEKPESEKNAEFSRMIQQQMSGQKK